MGITRGQVLPGEHGKGLSVCGAQVLHLVVQLSAKSLAEIHRVERFPAHCATHKFHGRHFIPIPLHEMLKLDRLLGTDSPALTATGTAGHTVKNTPLLALVRVIECARRAVLHARKASIAFFIDSKKGHGHTPDGIHVKKTG